MREEELSQGNEDRVNDERQDARSNQLLQYNLEWVNLPLGPNDNINQLFYDRLMLFAQDHNQDVMFYSEVISCSTFRTVRSLTMTSWRFLF
jgi:hypothetical protein